MMLELLLALQITQVAGGVMVQGPSQRWLVGRGQFESAEYRVLQHDVLVEGSWVPSFWGTEGTLLGFNGVFYGGAHGGVYLDDYSWDGPVLTQHLSNDYFSLTLVTSWTDDSMSHVATYEWDASGTASWYVGMTPSALSGAEWELLSGTVLEAGCTGGYIQLSEMNEFSLVGDDYVLSTRLPEALPLTVQCSPTETKIYPRDVGGTRAPEDVDVLSYTRTLYERAN